jgi:aminomethyltransferase
MTDGAPRKRAGLLPQGRAPMRAGTEVFATDNGGSPVGVVTSGGFAPSLGAPVALALIDAGIAEDTALWGDVRGAACRSTRHGRPLLRIAIIAEYDTTKDPRGKDEIHGRS